MAIVSRKFWLLVAIIFLPGAGIEGVVGIPIWEAGADFGFGFDLEHCITLLSSNSSLLNI